MYEYRICMDHFVALCLKSSEPNHRTKLPLNNLPVTVTTYLMYEEKPGTRATFADLECPLSFLGGRWAMGHRIDAAQSVCEEGEWLASGKEHSAERKATLT